MAVIVSLKREAEARDEEPGDEPEPELELEPTARHDWRSGPNADAINHTAKTAAQPNNDGAAPMGYDDDDCPQ